MNFPGFAKTVVGLCTTYNFLRIFSSYYRHHFFAKSQTTYFSALFNLKLHIFCTFSFKKNTDLYVVFKFL